MSGNSFGTIFRITTFGESHGEALGLVIDGCPSGFALDLDAIQKEMDRRRPGGTKLGTSRNEGDTIHVLSGLYEGRTTGAPIAMVLFNENQNSKDYGKLKDVFRPGHADYTYEKKWGIRDPRGGGRSSGRETSARVAAGAVAKQILSSRGVRIDAGVRAIGGIAAEGTDFVPPFSPPLFTVSGENDDRMLRLIEETRAEGDSLGGIVECRIRGLRAGIGEPCFDKLDALLAHAMLSIGAVKGIEFGLGFRAADVKGSVDNDQMDETGFLSNNAGGILGGISTGEEIVFRIAVKPTPSISREQRTVDRDIRPVELRIEGRHDPLIVVRILPVVEAMAALVILDSMLVDEAERSLR